MNRISAALALASILGLAGCVPEKLAGGAGAGNPPLADVTLAFKANSGPAPALAKSAAPRGSTLRNPDGTFSVADSVGTPILLTGIEVRVQRIEFDLPEGLTCAQVRDLPCADNEASVKGPYVMDLMTGSSTPAINFVKLPEGQYKTIGLQFTGPLPDSGIGGDTAINLTVRGETAGTQGKRKFRLDLDLRDGLDFHDSTGVPISAAAINRVVLSLSVDGWFVGTDFGKCLDGLQPAYPTDTVIVAHIQGDSACGGTGLRVRNNVESSSAIENEEEIQQP